MGEDDLMDVVHATGDVEKVARIFFPHFAQPNGGWNEEVLEQGVERYSALKQIGERGEGGGGIVFQDCVGKSEHLAAECGGLGLCGAMAVNQTRYDVCFDQLGQCSGFARGSRGRRAGWLRDFLILRRAASHQTVSLLQVMCRQSVIGHETLPPDHRNLFTIAGDAAQRNQEMLRSIEMAGGIDRGDM